MADATTLLLYALATARITLLITRDEILHGPRIALIDWINPRGEETGWRHTLAYMPICAWCTSVWVACAVVPLAHWYGHLLPVQLAATALAFSQITGMISRWGRD